MSLNPQLMTEMTVNTSGLSLQTEPAIVALTNGNFVAVWRTNDNTQDGSGNAIKGQVIRFNGSKVGAEFLINNVPDGNQSLPQIEALSDGRFVAVWQTDNSGDDGSGSAIKYRLFDKKGVALTSESLANTEASMWQRDPEVANLSNGRFAIVWSTDDSTQDGNGSAIKMQLFNSGGAMFGSEILVNKSEAGDQTLPVVAGLTNGNSVVVWQTSDTAQDGSGTAIKARIFKANGSPAGTEFQINSYTANDQLTPSVAALPNGRFMVTFATYSGAVDASLTAIHGRIYNANGNPVTGEFIVNKETQSLQTDPQVVAVGDRWFAVVWASHATGDYDVEGRLYNKDGTPASGEFKLHSPNGTSEFAPALAFLPDGRLFVAWHTTNTTHDGDSSAIRGRIVDLTNLQIGNNTKETLNGTAKGDFLFGKGGNDTLNGKAGADFLFGHAGNDTLEGKGGNDKLFGGNGHDIIRGGDGNDKATGGGGNDNIFGEGGRDNLHGNAGDDVIIGGDQKDKLFGEAGADSIQGGDGNDVIEGGAGNDSLFGDRGNDIIRGGNGNDLLRGDFGTNTLFGGKGNDGIRIGNGANKAKGGAGQDTFIFLLTSDLDPPDIILDFQDGIDKIDLSDFKFANNNKALSHFREAGGPNNDVVKFKYHYDDDAVLITIRGVDLSNISPQDIVI